MTIPSFHEISGPRGHQPVSATIVALFLGFLLTAHPCRALETREILLVANGSVAQSISLAEYYMTKRLIPRENLIILDVDDQETISREVYEKDVALPVRRYLKEEDPFRFIQCLVTMYGLPLKVRASKGGAEKRARLKELRKKREDLHSRIKEGQGKRPPEQEKALGEELRDVKRRIEAIGKEDERSSLDSELALVFETSYPLASWIPNPHFLGYTKEQKSRFRPNILMVSRLDGPSPESVRRLIDDSLAAEKAGLQGRAYFDARWGRVDEGAASGYRRYDAYIHKASDLVRKSGVMPVVLETREALFQKGDCPEAALYCGWYSLADYVDAFEWNTGAVGYHIASGECSTLKRKKSRVWCKKMLEKGVAATVGPVNEPYVESFPVPTIFFGLLIEGTWTLAECYLASNPFWSWKMVLIGDPLYRPFERAGMKRKSAGRTATDQTKEGVQAGWKRKGSATGLPE